MLATDARAEIEDLLHRAAEDSAFLDLLTTDPTTALAGTSLGLTERALVRSLDSVRLEEAGIGIRPFRQFLTYPSLGGRVGGRRTRPDNN